MENDTKLEELRVKLAEVRKKTDALKKEATAAAGQGKGKLRLETPIAYGEGEVTELVFDFTALTGMEYADAMDAAGAKQSFSISYRQGLQLFAAAVAKQMDQFDARDIVERISITDAVEGVQLATAFFAASVNAGFLRISKK